MKSKNIALASKIKKLRQKANYLQKQVAQYLNVVESTYSQYESGKSRPDFETLKKLATLYNVTLDYLLEHEVTHDFENTKQMIIEELGPGVEVHFEDATKVSQEQLRAMRAVWESLKAEKSRDKDKEKI